MSDANDKPPPPDTESQPSASGLPSSDRPLERIIGALNTTIKSFEAVAQMIYEDQQANHDATIKSVESVYKEVTNQGTLQQSRHETIVLALGKCRVEIATLTDDFEKLVISQEITTGATNTAREALDRTRAKVEDEFAKFGKAVKDATGPRVLALREELEIEERGPAPASLIRFTRKWSVKTLNVMWPITVRVAPTLVGRLVQILGGGVVVAALGKLVHFYFKYGVDLP